MKTQFWGSLEPPNQTKFWEGRVPMFLCHSTPWAAVVDRAAAVVLIVGGIVMSQCVHAAAATAAGD